MSLIEGKKREATNYENRTKRVGLFEARVIAINPDAEECKEILGFEPKEGSTMLNYLGKSEEGNKTARIDIWLLNVANDEKFKMTLFLEDKERVNREGTKKQYINAVGSCSWADDVNNLPQWFNSREFRVANVGEEDLYSFLRTWLGELDYRNAETTLSLDWEKMMNGKFKDLKDQVGGEWCSTIGALATIQTVVDGESTKEYQKVYKAVLPAYSIKLFRVIDFDNPKVIRSLSDKKSLKAHEKFVIKVYGEYGCKDYFILKDAKEYKADDNFASSDKSISDDGPDL